MQNILGLENSITDYLLVLLVYASLYIIIRYANRRVELNFRKSFRILFWVWSLSVFIGNYVFYSTGIMSFLPWLNNFIHSFIWIGLCLTFLFSGSRNHPLWEQFLLFAIFSLIVKAAEHYFLGTWELPYFFFIDGNAAYIIGWSLLDGLYSIISIMILKIFSNFSEGIIVPKPELF